MVRRGIGGILGAAVLAVALAACHDGDYLKSVRATAVFDESALDFGEVPVGEWREKTVTVRNAGHVPFTLLEAFNLEDNPSYVVDSPRELIGAFETREVKVRFHPLKEGELSTRVKIETDAWLRPEDPVLIRGVGAPARIQVNPPSLDFQTLEVDSDRVLEVQITNPVDIPLVVKLEGVDVAEFGADTVTIPPLSTQTLKARFAPKSVGDRAADLAVLACETCTPSRVEMRGRSVPFAFEFNPSPVPFQETPVHEKTQSYTQMTNITWRAVTVRGTATSDEAFSALTDLKDRPVQPGEAVKVDMQFAARFSGPNVGTMDVSYLSDKDRKAQVVLDARGGRPQLAITPITIDFGSVPVGGKVQQPIRLTNAGSNGALNLKGVGGAGAYEHFGVSAPFRGAQQYAWDPGSKWPNLTTADIPIQPGTDYLDLNASFQPLAAGTFEARLLVRTDDMFAPQREVVVKGTAYDPGPCAWRVRPWPELNFGNVPPDTGAILGFRFENAGSNICAVKDIHISNDGGGVFWMPGGALTGGVVLKDDAFSAMIAFRSKTAGDFRGELSITVNDPQNPVIKLPLVALAAQSCLIATPSPLNFGPIRYDCAPEPRAVHVQNVCSVPTTVSGIRIGAGTSDQYAITQAPPTPLGLNPGDSFEVEVTYARTVLGQHYSPLFFDVAGEPRPYLVPLWAETNHEGTAVDRFVQGQSGQLDVLFVVSNTTTMETYQNRLKADMPAWIAAAEAAGLSLQIGVTTTGLVDRSAACPGGANGGEAGRLFPADGTRQRIVQGTSTRITNIQDNLGVGLCHNLVQGLETMRMALSPPLVDHLDDTRTPLPNDGNAGFLRGSAQLAVVFVADEDDHSGFDPSSYIQFLQGLKGPNMSHRTQAYAIVPDGSCTTAGPSGARFSAVAKATGGSTASICSGSYQNLLSQVSRRAAGPETRFRLTYQVRSAAEITVTVNGVQSAPGDWTYDPADNAVVFAAGKVPAPGQSIEVRYVSECGTVTQ